MKIVIAGGTGFLGRPLTETLAAAGHEVVVLTRGQATARPGPGTAAAAKQRLVRWNAAAGDAGWRTEIDGADAVVNLAGESIAAHRWSAAQKDRILSSRLQATRALAQAIATAQR